jgi:hypothetical protein
MIEVVPPLERVPIEPLPPLSERERIRAGAQTAIALMRLENELGGCPDAPIPPPSEEEAQIARTIFRDARSPTRVEMEMPGVVRHLDLMLTEYDYSLIEDADRIRNYVVNRLLEESRDPKNAMKALELLGKLSNVNAFTERREVTVTHQSTEDLEQKLKDSLAILLDPEDVEIVSETPAPRAKTQPATPEEVQKLAETLDFDDLM